MNSYERVSCYSCRAHFIPCFIRSIITYSISSADGGDNLNKSFEWEF